MKNTIRFILVGLLCAAVPSIKAGILGSLDVDEGFVQRHSVSEELAQKLDKHSAKLAQLVQKVHATSRQKHGVWQFKSLPGYYVKYNVSRVVKREILAQCIKEEGLHLLHAPEKLLYHIKGRPTEFNCLNYVVLIKKVRDNSKEYHKRMNLEQVQQFMTAIEKSGHISTFEPNFLRLSGGRISFIDTDGTFNTDKPCTGFTRLLDRNLSHYYTPEALYYILDGIAEKLVIEQSQKRKKKCISDMGNFLGRQGRSMRRKINTVLSERTAHYKELYKNNKS